MVQKEIDQPNNITTEVLPETESQPERILSPAAKRALEEAQARRDAIDAKTKSSPREIGGRGGLDPARFGDWEVKGITSDF